ncbi:hypothetical protein EGW08_017456 [Elysia chlorotica]|uniref:Uncharacterized protein n=1 Tax=Elysia chlorotica TaxID=188477 RepID=A0A3S1B4E2_ELYCH|nr:hypothetical protein EGW08_017456 [Elysia chlorotica]
MNESLTTISRVLKLVCAREQPAGANPWLCGLRDGDQRVPGLLCVLRHPHPGSGHRLQRQPAHHLTCRLLWHCGRFRHEGARAVPGRLPRDHLQVCPDLRLLHLPQQELTPLTAGHHARPDREGWHHWSLGNHRHIPSSWNTNISIFGSMYDPQPSHVSLANLD